MIICSVNALEQLLKEKNMTTSDLTKEYGKLEAPELPPDEAVKKYGSMIRNAVKNPENTKYGTVKKLVEILGSELVVRVQRIEEISL